jgi:hypothetical protein
MALMALSQAADSIKLNVKPGLWEVSSVGQASGVPPIPEDTLAKMTPEQRARFQAAMQATMSNASKPRLFKNCITPEKIAQGFDVQPNQSASCQRTVTSISSSEFKVSSVCSGPDGGTTMEMHLQATGSEQVSGTVHVVVSRGGKTMTVDNNIHGKWLSSDCGNVTGVQMEP